jgi:hypothetical protein
MRTAKGTTARPTYGFRGDDDTGIHSTADNTVNIVCGGAVQATYNATNKAPWVLAIPVTAGDGAGVTESTANPYGYDVLVTNATFEITTQSAGVCTVDIGVGADATTSNDLLFDGLSTAAAGAFGGGVNGGTNGRNCRRWASTAFLNVAEASGDITGLVGVLYLTLVRI